MKPILTIILIVFISLNLNGQGLFDNFTVSAGINYGGAIPTEMDSTDYGAALPAAIAGIQYKVKINDKFSIEPFINYNLRRFKYGTVQKADTVVDVDITGDGNTVAVPTYYTAEVEGKAYSHQFNLRLPLVWRFNKISSAHIGVYTSVAMGGKDEATATVQIGEGSILDDVIEVSDAYESVNRFEFGISAGGTFYINERWNISFEGIRALTPYYEKGYYEDLNNGKDVKFYQTYGILRFNYVL